MANNGKPSKVILTNVSSEIIGIPDHHSHMVVDNASITVEHNPYQFKQTEYVAAQLRKGTAYIDVSGYLIRDTNPCNEIELNKPEPCILQESTLLTIARQILQDLRKN